MGETSFSAGAIKARGGVLCISVRGKADGGWENSMDRHRVMKERRRRRRRTKKRKKSVDVGGKTPV